jgi:hypothetical protein
LFIQRFGSPRPVPGFAPHLTRLHAGIAARAAEDTSLDVFERDDVPSARADAVAPHDPALFDGLRDAALMAAIRAHARDHKVFGYSAARRLIFGTIDNEGGFVTDVYLGKRGAVRSGSMFPAGFNTEHTWPQSLGVKNGPAKSDMHHLFPVDSHANSVRGNFPFGEVERVDWSSGESKRGRDKNGDMVFEPPDSHKGNVARALFYIADVYGLRIPAEEEEVLKRWNHEDPVDTAELTRNDLVSEYQENRNPFIDEPELADRIAEF